MKNIMISKREEKALEKVFRAIEELEESHEEVDFEQVFKSSQVEKVHMLVYMKFIKDLIYSAKALEGIVKSSEAEFIQIITRNGSITLDDAELNLMAHMLEEIVRG